MTIKQLIEELKKYPDDSCVLIYDNEYDTTFDLTEIIFEKYFEGTKIIKNSEVILK